MTKQLNFFAFSKSQKVAKSDPRHPEKPMMFACADCPRRGFCGTSSGMARRGTSRGAVARLGLSNDAAEREVPCTSEEVLRRVQDGDGLRFWQKKMLRSI